MKEDPLIPTLNHGQRSVVFSEVNTGILLTPEGGAPQGPSEMLQGI